MIDWIILGICLLLLIPTGYAAKIGAPWAPTFQRAIDQLFADLQIGTGDVIVDLGAGDGKVMTSAIKRGATAIGYELSPIMWLIAYVRLRITGISRPRLYLANFFQRTLPAETTHVFIFLMPDHMEKVRRFLSSQHLPKARYFFSYMFPIKSLEADLVIRPSKAGPVFVYDWQKIAK